MHPNFRHAILPESASVRAVIESWADGFADRDGKFIDEFQRTFNSGFWELYLFATFKHLGWNPSLPNPAPDFALRTPSQEFVAEAVVALHAKDEAPEWGLAPTLEGLASFDAQKLVEYACVRLAASIREKSVKYDKQYSRLPHVAGKPYVICVAPFEQPMAYLQVVEAIRAVLFGVDQPVWLRGPDGEQVVIGEVHRDSVKKPNSAPIDLGLFFDPAYANVSAVIFSNTATWGKAVVLSGEADGLSWVLSERFNADATEPKKAAVPLAQTTESIEDGLHVFLNPRAICPLDVSSLRRKMVGIHLVDQETGEYVANFPDDLLLVRQIMSFRVAGSDAAAQARGRDYAPPTVHEPVDLEFWPVAGQVAHTTAVHMGFYRGWTILAAVDLVDRDWMAQAIPGRHRSVPAYIRANESQHRGFVVTPDGHASMEAAVQDVAGQINDAIEAFRSRNR